MKTSVLFLYLGTWFVVALTPGPAVFSAMTQATRHGFRASLAGILGTQAGNLVFFICIAFGLVTLLQTASVLFEILRVLGAVYLGWLGARVLLRTFRRRATVEATATTKRPALRGLFLQGLAIQLTNPKALVFVSALVPQFIDPERPVGWQITVLLVVTVFVDLWVLSGYAAIAARGSGAFRNSSAVVWMERAFGTVLVLLGFRLLLSRK